MADLIDRQALLEKVQFRIVPIDVTGKIIADCVKIVRDIIEKAPAVDAVEVATLEKWLYEIAMNNIGAPVEDMAAACEIIISRLDLRRALETGGTK